MEIIVILIAISVTIALVFLGVFYWNIRSGQYDDTYTPSVRILFDDKTVAAKASKKNKILNTEQRIFENGISKS